MLPWGTCGSKVPKEPFSFMEGDNTGTKADRLHAGGVLHAKEEVGWGGGAQVQGRGTRRLGTVVGVCLMPEGGVSVRV